jgi:hypothetical protein
VFTTPILGEHARWICQRTSTLTCAIGTTNHLTLDIEELRITGLAMREAGGHQPGI